MLSVIFSTFCYITIFVKLSHHQAQVQDHIHHGQHNNRGSQLNVSQYRKTLLICFLPYGVEKTLFAKNGFESSILSNVAVSFVSLNSALNPIIYPWKITEVRQAIRATTEDLFQIWVYCLSRKLLKEPLCRRKKQFCHMRGAQKCIDVISCEHHVFYLAWE